MNYSLGAFLNITSPEPKVWEHAAARLRRLRDRGHVEVWLEYIPKSGTETRQLRSVLKDEQQLILHAPFIGLSLISHVPEIRRVSVDRLRHSMEVGAELGANAMTIHVGQAPSFDKSNDYWSRLTESLTELRQRGLPQLSLENMPAKHGASREWTISTHDLGNIIHRFPDVKVTLDIGHAIQNGDDWSSFIRDHPTDIAVIHLHDGFLGGKAHQRLGTAQLDVDKFIGVCAEAGYSGFVSLETLGWGDTKASWNQITDRELAHG